VVLDKGGTIRDNVHSCTEEYSWEQTLGTNLAAAAGGTDRPREPANFAPGMHRSGRFVETPCARDLDLWVYMLQTYVIK
jgi:hypothetical protein